MLNPEFKQESLANLLVVKNITNKYGGGVIKSLGQNFLVNQSTLFRFIDTLDISIEDTIIEIGPGIGVVSYTLCERAKKVILIELDRSKEPALRKVLENFDNYELIFADASNFDYSTLGLKGNVKVIGSLPYKVAKKIIYNLFNSNINWNKSAFLLQKEVAENYTTQPPHADFLANFAKIYSNANLKFLVPNKHFYPIPKVQSAVILFERIERNISKKTELSKFIKQGFSQPRKTINNNLKSIGIEKEDFLKIGINPMSRPSELEIDQWIQLFTLDK
jgi:16S rRNA (adenine1518-N6/adenine1519-N6)-dimethyltransferase